MVMIINGEIVADDDPRLQQRQPVNPSSPRSGGTDAPGGVRRPTAATPGGGAGAGGGGGIGFILSAPPLRFVPPPPGVQPLLGLPDAEVFGVRLSPYAIFCAVTLGMFYGWRGVVMVMVIYYVFLASQNNTAGTQGQGPPAGAGPAGAAAGGQQQQGDTATDFLTRYMNGPQPRSRPAAGAGVGAARAAPGRAGPEAATGGGADAVPAGAREAPGAGDGGGWAAFQGRGNKLGGK